MVTTAAYPGPTEEHCRFPPSLAPVPDPSGRTEEMGAGGHRAARNAHISLFRAGRRGDATRREGSELILPGPVTHRVGPGKPHSIGVGGWAPQAPSGEGRPASRLREQAFRLRGAARPRPLTHRQVVRSTGFRAARRLNSQGGAAPRKPDCGRAGGRGLGSSQSGRRGGSRRPDTRLARQPRPAPQPGVPLRGGAGPRTGPTATGLRGCLLGAVLGSLGRELLPHTPPGRQGLHVLRTSPEGRLLWTEHKATSRHLF